MLETIFEIGNLVAITGWIVLILIPTWRNLAQIIAGAIIPVLLALAYTALIGVWWSRGEGGFGSLDDVALLFQSRPLLLAGWLHYLAFDLLIGAWVARTARAEGIAHAIVIPLLLLTFLFGPVGYLGLQIIRLSRRWGSAAGANTWLSGLRDRWAEFCSREPILVWFSLILLLAMIPTAIAYGLDDRMLNGVNIWMKPLKFQLSLAVFGLTLVWLMPLASQAFRRGWGGRLIVWGFIFPSLFEIGYIVWRASRGEASHFNIETPLASMFYSLMGVGAITIAATSLVLAYGIARKDAPYRPSVFRLAAIIGLVLSFVFATANGMAISRNLSHFVGQPPFDAGSIPIFGWSLAVGDLRVAHFLGLHAQQIIPLAGAVLAGMNVARDRLVLIAFSVAYAALTLFTFVQALQGRPLVSL
ncbi:MAG: ABA4-like family protein [Hyphomicrobiales bacterium]